MPVTSIQDVINAANRSILFINTEFSGNNAEILNGQDVNVNNCWIPWCTRNSDFAAHHIQVQDETGNVLWFIWQNGPLVRASRTGFDPDAPAINGDADVGQSLTLAVNNVSIRTYRPGAVPPFIDSDLPL